MLEHPFHNGSRRGESKASAHEASTAASRRDRNNDAIEVRVKAASGIREGGACMGGKDVVAVLLKNVPVHCNMCLSDRPSIGALHWDFSLNLSPGVVLAGWLKSCPMLSSWKKLRCLILPQEGLVLCAGNARASSLSMCSDCAPKAFLSNAISVVF